MRTLNTNPITPSRKNPTSLMITGEIKSRVERIWDTIWSGGISNPLSVIEQLTDLLFIKRLDFCRVEKMNGPVAERTI